MSTTTRPSAASGQDARRPLATPGELAEYLGNTVDGLAQWRFRGTGPRFIKVGRQVRYHWEDVEAWLSAQTFEQTGGAA